MMMNHNLTWAHSSAKISEGIRLGEKVGELHLSHCEFYGSSGPCIQRVQGSIFGHTIQVLLDSGSLDNFIQPHLAKILGLHVEVEHYFKVWVGNSHYLTCEGMVKHIPIQIQDLTINVSVVLLPKLLERWHCMASHT